jgi:hypothetical protein
MRRFAGLALVVALLTSGLAAQQIARPGAARATGTAPRIMAAGVPAAVGLTHDYDKVYAELERGGMHVYFPYTAVDGTVGVGPDYEFADFYGLYPPGKQITCDPTNPAFTRLSAHGVRLLLSGDAVYNRGNIPTGAVTADDPLQRLINCAGRSNIEGVLIYDESVRNGVPSTEMQAFHDRVKLVDSTMPIFNIQAPLVRTNATDVPAADATAYFNAVKDTFQYADISGFDVYPRPDRVIENLATPYSNGAAPADYKAAIEDYAKWTAANTTSQTWMVLQAFTPHVVAQFPKLYGPSFDLTYTGVRAPTAEPFGGGYDFGAVPGWSQLGGAQGSGLQGPTEAELREMAKISVQQGVSYIGFYGQSFVGPEDNPAWRPATGMGTKSLWESVVTVSNEAAAGTYN